MAAHIFDKAGRSAIYLSDKTCCTDLKTSSITEVKNSINLPFIDAHTHQTVLPGMCIIYGQIHVTSPQTVYFNMLDEPDFVEMHFTLDGAGSLQSNATGCSYPFCKNEYSLHYMPGFQGSGEYQSNMYYRFLEVRFSKEFFIQIAENSSATLMDFANKVADHASPEISKKSLPTSFAMQQCLHEIVENKLCDGLKMMYLQSKCIELLALQAQAYEQHSEMPYVTCKTQVDKDRIYFAGEYLIQHAQSPPSLTALAKIANINVFKLKKGFREIFNNTVYGYLNDYRLKEARKELLDHSSSIKELSFKLGYSSVQHFTKAFKKRFGVSPGEARRNGYF